MVCRWEGGVFSQWGTSVQTLAHLFLETLTEGAVTTEAGSLFQYFTTLIENADTSGKKDNLRGTSHLIVRNLHLVGLIGRSHFFDQSHAAVRAL